MPQTQDRHRDVTNNPGAAMTFTSNQFFLAHAPDFNFEHDAAALLALALERGFIVKVGGDAYRYSE